uniref:Uncharacterized protein n=1 Tax=Anguilla anguilla TaxID=7936 RepID=A0A0E9QEQ8_ANGAN
MKSGSEISFSTTRLRSVLPDAHTQIAARAQIAPGLNLLEYQCYLQACQLSWTTNSDSLEDADGVLPS